MCCSSDNQNDNPTSDNCGAAPGSWIAWKYAPSCDIAIDRLELYVPSGRVALFADANGQPGAVLFEATLSPATTPGWSGADVSPPIPVAPGQVYWLAQRSNHCSIAAFGHSPTEWTSSDLGGPWSGPFHGDKFTAHVFGACP